MPVTLEQAKQGMREPYEQAVYDEFGRSSLLLGSLIYDNAVSPGTGGSNLIYGYTSLKTPSTAQYREINEDYEPDHAVREEKTTKLKILGGAYQIDRVIQTTSGIINEAEFQASQKIQAAANLFHNTVINGDDVTDPKSFDGLSKLLTGTSTELNTDGIIDLTDTDDSNKFLLLDELDEFLSELDGTPTMLMGNSKLITKIKAYARRAGYYTRSENAFGVKVDNYDGIGFVDLGNFTTVDAAGNVTNRPIVNTVDREIGGETVSGLTDLYAVDIAMDGFHGVTPTGENAGITSNLPDFNGAGTVKRGDVEMVVGIALKQTRKAGVLRNLKIA